MIQIIVSNTNLTIETELINGNRCASRKWFVFHRQCAFIADRSLVPFARECAAIKNRFMMCGFLPNPHIINRHIELICYANPVFGNNVINLNKEIDVAFRSAKGLRSN
jgi:hypothetical protein